MTKTATALAPAMPELPAFLRREKNAPPPMSDPHRLAVLQLTTAECVRIWTRCVEKDKNFPALDPEILQADGEAVAAKALLLAAVKHGNGQAELVMSIMRDNTPVANAAAEKLTGKPIQRLPEKGAHAPRTTKPQKTRPGQTFQGDDQIIRLVAESNPRKAGTRAFMLYAKYEDGMTVAAYVAAGGGRGNVKCDCERGNIRLEPATKVAT